MILKIIIPNPMMKQLTSLLEAEGIGEGIGNEEAALPRFLKCKNRIYCFHNKLDIVLDLKKIISGLLQETYLERFYKRPAIYSLLVLLLITVGRNSRERLNENILQKVSDYIQSNIQEANLGELAGQMGYSNRQLSRKIRDSSGGTFSDLLWKIRQLIEKCMTAGTDKKCPLRKRICPL